MSFLNYVKGLINRLFGIKDIKTALNIDVAVSQEMLNCIDLWTRCYSGKAPWCSEDVKSLRLEQAIVREFANISLNEMTVNITNNTLSKIYEKAVKNLNKNFQAGLASGAMVIKPLGEDKVQFVSASSFIPVEYDVNGRLIKVIFPELKQLGDNDFYTRLEFHSLDYEKGLTITNKAYYSTSSGNLGREIPLTSIKEWEKIKPNSYYPLMLRPAFGCYVNPLDNTIDGSRTGVSIFEPALEMIKKTDIQFGRLDWEFESGERAIIVDELALKPTNDGNSAVDKLNKRLYKAVNSGDENFYHDFSPAFRQSDIISGLDEYKREIEFAVGLSYGDISNPQSIDKTATEIKAAKNRKYNMVTAIQENLKNCLDDLVYSLAFYNSLTTSGYEFVCNFKDSILTDEDTERKQDIQDVSMGAMQLWEYRMKWYSEDEKTAKAMTAKESEVIE